jgi:SAM-dependent methyltransferase
VDRPDAPRGLVLSSPRPRGRDRELEAGSRAHYEDPAGYSQTYARRLDDVAYYTRLAARRGGPVLEIGIGNGRIALPLARHGHAVTGVDQSAAMLASLRARLRAEPPEVRARITVRKGDMRRVRLRRRFPLVLCTFNTALHLYSREDFEAFFARVREHLAPGGLFVMDLSVPMPEDLARDPSKPHKVRPFFHATSGLVRWQERFDYDRVRQILFVTAEVSPVHGAPYVIPLAHRQLFPQETEALLHYNGFEATEVHGDWAGGPLTQESEVMIWHARARRAR